MDVLLFACASAAFMAVAGSVFAIGQLVVSRNRLQRRLPAGVKIAGAPGESIGALVAERFAEDRFGIGQRFRQQLRLRLTRAGYFSRTQFNFTSLPASALSSGSRRSYC